MLGPSSAAAQYFLFTSPSLLRAATNRPTCFHEKASRSPLVTKLELIIMMAAAIGATIWYEAKELQDEGDTRRIGENLFELELDRRGNKIRYVPKRKFKPIHSNQYSQEIEVFGATQMCNINHNQLASTIIKLRIKLEEINKRIAALEIDLSSRAEDNPSNGRKNNKPKDSPTIAALQLPYKSLLWLAWPVLVQLALLSREARS